MAHANLESTTLAALPMKRPHLTLQCTWLCTSLLAACAMPPAAAPTRSGSAEPILEAPACALPTSPARPVQTSAALEAQRDAPEPANGYAPKPLTRGQQAMVVTAHPLASQAACEMLRQGGSAVDAAIAAQWVLSLVEPQSSGLGGGGFLLHHAPASQKLTAYDGRETAPAAATPDDLRWINPQQPQPPRPSPRASGRSIGVPGLVRMLALAHQDGGRLPWARLFEPALQLAEQGFAVSPRLAQAIRLNLEGLRQDPRARAYFLDAQGQPWPVGHWLRSPALAQTLRQLADQGADAFFSGPLAQDMVSTASDTRDGMTPSKLQMTDLRHYQALRREALCQPYRRWWVCGMPPPSSGGLAVAQTLGILAHFDLSSVPPTGPLELGGRPQVQAVHWVSEAERLAYADRDRYVADPAFASLPGGSAQALLAAPYLSQRAALIDRDRSMGTAVAGEFPGLHWGEPAAIAEAGTTHLSVVDPQGHVVAMTSSIEAGFGAWHMTAGGFMLNNQLTDFSAQPRDAQGRLVANRLEGGKRPRSAMSPTLVFERQANGQRGAWVMATGSPGGATIIQYTVKTLIGVLDWGLDAQQASALMNFGAMNSPITLVGGEHPLLQGHAATTPDPLVAGLQGMGHQVQTPALASGVATLVRRVAPAPSGIEGGQTPGAKAWPSAGEPLSCACARRRCGAQAPTCCRAWPPCAQGCVPPSCALSQRSPATAGNRPGPQSAAASRGCAGASAARPAATGAGY